MVLWTQITDGCGNWPNILYQMQL